MKTKVIKQAVVFKATPHEVYELLMDSKKHSAFTESKAKISRKVGENFSAYDGYIIGKNIEILNDKKIIQMWRGVDWPENHYSKITFLLKKTKTGTMLTFTQTGVPEEFFQTISHGWFEHYWERMKEYLKK